MRNRLKHAAGGVEEFNIANLCMTSHFIKPAYRFGLQTSFRRAIDWINQLDFHLDGVLAPLDPPLSFFALLTHGTILVWKINRNQNCPSAFRHPGPNHFHFGTVNQLLPNHDRWVWLAMHSLFEKVCCLQSGDQLPRGNLSFLTPFIGMPRNKKTVISDGIPYLVEKSRHRCIILPYHR